MKKVLIAPSILSADFSNLSKDIASVEKAGAQWLHVDVMDGHFVPNITIGPPIVKALRKRSKLFFDVHLMIERPDIYWKAFRESGADLIVFHTEVECDIKKVIMDIKKSGIKAGLSLKPGTDEASVIRYIKDIDVMLVMTVEPGFGGQQFMDKMVPRIERFRSLIDKKNPKCLLEVDGGINGETAPVAVKAGADVVVAGNYIFSKGSPGKNLKKLRSLFDSID